MSSPEVTQVPEEAQQEAVGVPWYVYVLVINAVLGTIMFEWAWLRTKRVRAIPEKMPDLDKAMDVFKRVDLGKW